MKKKLSIIIVAIIVLIIIFIVLIPKKELPSECADFELEEVLLEINLATGNRFNSLETKEISEKLPIGFLNETDYIFSYNIESDNEYFILARNLSENELFDLKNHIDTNNELYEDNQIKLVEIGIYVYAIWPSQYDSVIDGIIRSYIHCE